VTDTTKYILYSISDSQSSVMRFLISFLFQHDLYNGHHEKYSDHTATQNRLNHLLTTFINSLDNILTEERFQTLNNTTFAKKFKTRSNFKDLLKTHDDSITIDDIWELLCSHATTDLFMFHIDGETKQPDVYIQNYHHPDNYDTSHQPLYMFEINGIIYNIIPVKFDTYNRVSDSFISGTFDEEQTLTKKHNSLMYKWITTVVKSHTSFTNYVETYDPAYYPITTTKILNRLKVKKNGRTINQYVNRFKKAVYYQLDVGDDDDTWVCTFPVFPYVYSTHPSIDRHPIEDFKPPPFADAMKSLAYMNQTMPKSSFQASQYVVVGKSVVGIVCENNLILPCTKIKYDAEVHTLPVSETATLYESMNQELFEEHIVQINKMSELKIRDYLYDKLRYAIMKDPSIINGFKAPELTEQFQNLPDTKHEIFKDIEPSYSLIYENDLEASTLVLPEKYRAHYLKRLLYEMKKTPLKKRVPRIPNMFLFHKQAGETFTVRRIITPISKREQTLVNEIKQLKEGAQTPAIETKIRQKEQELERLREVPE
jgi:hypothetical protein